MLLTHSGRRRRSGKVDALRRSKLGGSDQVFESCLADHVCTVVERIAAAAIAAMSVGGAVVDRREEWLRCWRSRRAWRPPHLAVRQGERTGAYVPIVFGSGRWCDRGAFERQARFLGGSSPPLLPTLIVTRARVEGPLIPRLVESRPQWLKRAPRSRVRPIVRRRRRRRR